MSKDTKKKVTREEKKKQAVRVLALIMAALMILGVAYYALAMLIPSVSAAGVSGESYEYSEAIDTSSLKNSGDVLISVGLMYGSNLTTGFETTVTDGFLVGIQELYGDKSFTEIWELDETALSCTADDNLSEDDRTYTIARRERDTDVGGYHLEVDCGRYDREEVEDLIDENKRALRRMGLELFPCWIDGEYALRVGAFASADEAEEWAEDVEDIFDLRVSVAEPSRTAVSVVDPDENRIVFEFDGEGDYELGLAAQEDRIGNTYLTTPAGNTYDGVFCFKRSRNDEVDGVSLINILPLEAYVAGVLPYELTNEWPLEALKAFAITVRSFTLSHLEKHGSYDFDMCNTVDCQVYKGTGKINSRVMKAVQDTEGLVMTYEGQIVTAYYSSSVGGVTVSAQDAWGNQNLDVPYLQAVETPWELYMAHENAFWTREVSPEELCEQLNSTGYTELKDAIEDVEIVELAENSTYVKELRVTDIHGHEVTIRYTDAVRIALLPLVNSANFVVGKGSVEYTVPADAADADWSAEPFVEEEPEEDEESAAADLSVITPYATERWYGNEMDVITADGVVSLENSEISVITAENVTAMTEMQSIIEAEPEDESENQKSASDHRTETDVVTKKARAKDRDNFIFVGKGWGHGVGMSAYGMLDLSDLGYTAEEILDIYFADVKIKNYRKTDAFR